MKNEERAELEELLRHRFAQPEWLEQALTHRSRREGGEGRTAFDNESLEFLGDRVLGRVISDRLFQEFPSWDAGKLSKAQARLVSTASVHAAAHRLGLGKFLRLGRGEEKTGGRQKERLLANCYEAVIAAIYRDAGFEAAAAFVERTLLAPALGLRADGLHLSDHKSALQEWLQHRALGRIEYRVCDEYGPDHRKIFEVEAWLNGRRLASSAGHTKKEAEQEAARIALEALMGAEKKV